MQDLSIHEKRVPMRPTCVKYICESCNKGEMKVMNGQLFTVSECEFLAKNTLMINHKCTECGFMMALPKSYPYIEWEEVDQDADNGTEIS